MRILYALVLALLMAFSASAQSYVQVGSGDVPTSYPVYGAWANAWYSAIYPAQVDLGSNDITHIALNCNNGPKTANNQKIYLKLTNDDEFADASYESPESNGYTLVFDGDITFDGWTQIDITDFEYDGSSNIIVHWESRNGDFNYQYPNFNSTTSEIDDNKGNGNDLSFPEESGYPNPYPSSLPNIRFYYEASGDVPETPQNEIPENNEIKVEVDTELIIDLGDFTDTYDIYLGTNETLVTDMDESVLIAEDITVTDPGTYTYAVTESLESKTEYFWRVVAKNAADQTASPVFTFETQRVISDFPYTQGFEDEEIWTPGWYGDLSLTDWYYTSSPVSWNKSSESNGYTGSHSATCSPAGTGGEFILMTPRMEIPANHHISFWWRNNDPIIDDGDKVAGTDATYIEISTDGAETWTELGVIEPDEPTDWNWELFDISAFSGDNVYIRWRYEREDDQEGTPIFIDDVAIDETTNEPEISLSETTINFPNLAMGGSYGIPVVVSNTGTSDLIITDVTTSGVFSSDFSGTIAPGETEEAVIFFEPTDASANTGSATFNVDGSFSGENTVSLSGTSTALNSNFYQGFDASEEMPEGWSAINNPDHDYTHVDVVSDVYGAYSAPNVAKFVMFTEHNYPVTLVTPGVDGFESNKLTFYAKKGDEIYDVSLIVGVMDNPYDPNSFEEVTTLELTDEHQEFEITFPETNTKPYIGFRHSQNPEETSVTSIWVDDITWDVEGENPPAVAQEVAPEDEETNVDIMMGLDLVWASGGGAPEGYKLFVGTNPEADNMIDGEVLEGSNATNYKISKENLDYSQTYYWQVVPFNENGDATDCPVWSFTTMNNPVISSLPFFEDFDDLENDDGYTYPMGWSIENANEDNICWDILSNSDYSPNSAYSAPNAMHVAFHPYNAKDDYLFTPPIQMQADEIYSVNFMLQTLEDAVTGLVYSERIKVLVGSTNSSEDMTIEVLDTKVEELGWKEVLGTFSVPEDGEYFVAFYTYSDPDQYLIIIDDVSIDVLETYAVTFASLDENGTLNAEVDGGPINSGDEVYENAEVTFSAEPNDGYQIKEWTLNGDVIADYHELNYTISSLSGPAEVNVAFEEIPTHSVTFATASDNGEISATVNGDDITSGQEVDEGAEVVFTASPNDGYQVKEWQVDGNTVDDHTENTYVVSELLNSIDVTVDFEIITNVNSVMMSEVNAFPNPFNNSISITNGEGVRSAEFTNLVGQQVMKVNLANTGTINTSKLTKGVYIVTLHGENGERKILRMVKE
ncbi:MAG: choice-of-anchor J domain-containing protein [Bacteroidales bacterium]